jgi:hypothetical protein
MEGFSQKRAVRSSTHYSGEVVYTQNVDMTGVSGFFRVIRETVGAATQAHPHGRQHGVCPKCGARDVRRSSNKQFGDDFMSLFSLAPFRCRSCRQRFFLKGEKAASAEAVEVNPKIEIKQ